MTNVVNGVTRDLGRAAGGETCWFRRGAERFVNYSRAWRHFSLPGTGRPAYDFPMPCPATHGFRLFDEDGP